MTRRKRLVSDAAVVLSFFLLIGLGTWQVQRLHWKEGLIAERTTRFAAPPIASWDQAAEYRRARFEGTWLSGRTVQIGLMGRTITPFLLDDGTTVLVETRQPPPPAGRGVAEGYLRGSDQTGAFTPANEPAKGLWYSADVPAIEQALGLENPRPWRIVAGAPPELPNDHLQYAITWYSLAAVLVIVYLLARRKAARP
jgi:surfeit locus 1 family protein